MAADMASLHRGDNHLGDYILSPVIDALSNKRRV